MLIVIFLVLLQWVTVSCTVSALDEATLKKDVPFLVVEPISSRDYVIKRVQETLNLTCTVFYNSTNMEPHYNITWSVPSSSRNSKNHVLTQSSRNLVNLVVTNLESRDEGKYTCIAQPVDKDLKPLNITVKVYIKNRRCDTMFKCNLSKLQNCIPHRYTCDGHQDCEKGEDEHYKICGTSPCNDKFHCEDPSTSLRPIRCIPKDWCCNIRTDDNCTIKEPLSCCHLPLHKSHMDERSYYSTHQPHYPDMSLLQTTIYTAFGCAMVFMIVVTVLVIAICRVHMKRTFVTQCPVNVMQPSQNTPLYDLDAILNQRYSRDRDFLVTYNINNGVQIVGHAIDPPPYCEQVISVPPREGPPPPYSSHERLDQPETEALLQQPPTVHCTSEHLRRVVSEQNLLETTTVQASTPRHNVVNSVNLIS
ncbi:uncharacterized protein LOC124369084 isoform X1 [Homalodisca vitripennis]|uniref:uncharacterized protein LOC124369084 isoform X1 n=1 Tax=Homalodisca vitripennis TaxID=197043 RepID=UPI001EEAB6FC|nr:uncharacterized protein LOC124369084 isoform X1 [Homalodisca vitripennis]